MATENDVSVIAPSTPHIIKKDSSSDGAVRAKEEKKVPLVVASTTKISPQNTQQESTENQETAAEPNFSSAQKNTENSIQSDSGLSNKRTLETTNISESGPNKKVCTVENRESSVVSQEKRELSCGNDVSVKTEKTEHIAPKTVPQPIAQNMDTVANNNNKIININTKEKPNKNNTSVKATGASSSTGSNKKVSTSSTSGNNGNKDANQSIESILAGIKDECSADMTVVKTVHCMLNLLQTYGPLTYDQLDFNLPPECVKSPGRLQQIIDILMLTGTISVFDENCTENLENDRGMLYEEKKKMNKITSSQKEHKGAPSMLDKNIALSRIVSSDTKTETKAITTYTSSSEENKAAPPISKDDDQSKNEEPAKSQNVDGAPSIVPVWVKDVSLVAQPSEDKKIKIENSSTQATKNNASVSDNTSSKDSENIVNKNNATNKSKDEKPEEINQKSCIDAQLNSSLTTKESEKPVSIQTSTTASSVNEQGKPVVVDQESPPKKPVLAKVHTKVKDENLDLKESSVKEASVAVKARKYMFADGKFYHCAQTNIISLSNGNSERGTTTNNNNTNGVCNNMSSDNNSSRSMNDKSNSGITKSSPVLLLPQLLPELECARVEIEESKERIDILRHALEVKPTSVRKDNAIKIKLENGFETKSSEISEILDKVRNEESVGELIHYLVAKYPSLSSDPIYSSALKHF